MRKIHHPGPYCNATEHAWRVTSRYCNYSAFNGFRRTPSEYSGCVCLACGYPWRTKGEYVGRLPDATNAESRTAGTNEKWTVYK